MFLPWTLLCFSNSPGFVLDERVETVEFFLNVVGGNLEGAVHDNADYIKT